MTNKELEKLKKDHDYYRSKRWSWLKWVLFESEYHGRVLLDILSTIFLIAFFVGGIWFTVYALSYEDSATNVHHSTYQEEQE